MITLNLLPDIKKEYLRTQRLKRLFMVGSLLTSLGFVALTILLALFVFGVQRLQLSDVQSDIDSSLAQLQSVQDLDKIVTIQKQLEVLPGLHEGKPAANRIFSYLSSLVPAEVSLNKAEFIMIGDEVGGELSGAAASPKAVNVFVDTIKNAQFTYEGAESPIKPFTSVVLDDPTVQDDKIQYKITIKFDPLLFDNTLVKAQLSVPKITTTTSVAERPRLFDDKASD